jgi:hypothetical protein
VQGYLLDDDHKPYQVTFEVYCQEYWESQRQVALTQNETVMVSTIFLGLDHRFFNDGPPILFETMVFGGPYDEFQDRTCTWDEALEAHKEICAVVFGIVEVKMEVRNEG